MKSTRKILKEPRQAPRAGAGLLAVLLFLFGFAAPLGAQAAEIPQNSETAVQNQFDRETAAVFKSEEGRTLVVPVGQVYGLHLSSDGIIVSGLTDLYVNGQPVCPAAESGLKPGDFILEIDGQTLETCVQLTQALNDAQGSAVELLCRREENTFTTTLQPVSCDNDGQYRAGLWIKDGVSGIGTVTFIDPETGVFASLGHGVCDADSGALLTSDGGELLQVTLGEIVKGTSGEAGELTGSLSAGGTVGTVNENTAQGVYGIFNDGADVAQAVEVARRDEVHTGTVEIVADPTGEGPIHYTAEIESLNPESDADSKNFVIRVTDDRLLELTGGIVQGMSGSPILQDGRLVGAVTHVFVDDPTRGYGIFAETMLEQAEQ